MSTADPFDLERFVIAQEPVMTQVLAELKVGRKRTHWMWFVFPQLRGLGRSSTAQFYGIGFFEACAYLAHPVLGPRLDLCTRIVLAVENRSAPDIFGSPDDLKFYSSMTLFALAAGGSDSIYHKALARWRQGKMDPGTLRLLGIAAQRRVRCGSPDTTPTPSWPSLTGPSRGERCPDQAEHDESKRCHNPA